MPVGATSAFDLRGPQGVSGDPFSPAKALFITPDSVVLANPWVQVASDPLEQLNSVRRRALMDYFENTTATRTRLAELLLELWCGHADLSKTKFAPPPIAGSDGQIELRFGTVFTAKVRPFIGSPEWAGLRAQHQASYRQIKAMGDPLLHRKYMATLARKYRLTETQAVDEFTPSDLPKESPVEPTTTLSEAFTGTGAALGADLTWTEVSGTWDRSVNQGRRTGATGLTFARAEHDLSTDDMKVSVTLVSSDSWNFNGPMARYSSSANTGYSIAYDGDSNDMYGVYWAAGADTGIITDLGAGSGLGTTLRIEVDGSGIAIFKDGVARGSTTDTNVTGNLRGGLAFNAEGDSTNVFDNWSAEDIAAGGGLAVPISAYYRMMGMR